MRDTSRVGNITEAAVLSTLVDRGYDVLIPFGGGAGYDLAYDTGKKIVRVQAKTGRLTNGVVKFNTASLGRNGQRTGYAGRADEFGVYCRATGKVYLVPVDKCSANGGWLRIDPTKNNQSSGIMWAADYEVR